MSEEKRSFMEELDLWTEANITGVLFQIIHQMNEYAEYDDPPRYQEGHEKVKKAIREGCENVKKAIREKVLESYRNGLAAGPSRAPRSAYKPRGK